MPYATPVNHTGLTDMFVYVNEVTENMFSPLLLISLYVIVIVYLIMRNNRWEDAALAAGFITTITAIILRVTEILTVDRYIFMAVASIVIPLVIVFVKDRAT